MADTVNTENLELKLQELAEGLGLSVKEFVEGGFLDKATYQIDMEAVNSRLDAIDVMDETDGVETLAEKIKGINDVLANEEGELQGILNLITANSTKIGQVETDLSNYKTANDQKQTEQDNKLAENTGAISTLDQRVVTNREASEQRDAELSDRVTGTENDIATLKGDATVVGSVAKAIKDSQDAQDVIVDSKIVTAKTEAIAGAKTYTDAEIAKINADLDAITGGETGSLTELDGRVSTLENDMNDTLAEDGVTVEKGVKTKVADLETALANETQRATQAEAQVLADAKAHSDSQRIVASSMDVCPAINKFRGVLGQAPVECNTAPVGDGEAI